MLYAGVRRGVSLRAEGGPTVAQMATMLVNFVVGLVALGAAWLGWTTAALAVLLVASLAAPILDAGAARRGEAPLLFARLRPFLIPIARAGLAVLLVLRLVSGQG